MNEPTTLTVFIDTHNCDNDERYDEQYDDCDKYVTCYVDSLVDPLYYLMISHISYVISNIIVCATDFVSSNLNN